MPSRHNHKWVSSPSRVRYRVVPFDEPRLEGSSFETFPLNAFQRRGDEELSAFGPLALGSLRSGNGSNGIGAGCTAAAGGSAALPSLVRQIRRALSTKGYFASLSSL